MASSFLHPFTPPRKKDFLSIARGDGALVYDEDGKEYIDGMGSLWYINVGHGRKEVADAMADQAKELAGYHTFDPFTNPRAEELATKIAALSPFDEPRVFFGSSG
jgi:adenosylmethionine-8-amino-7-oxononanoate aminotransferase